ncbi:MULTISPECIES: hypothetical protein [unclassified Beijerinckia]|uniref:hypothetical protein n=1 Tax=unclassified Beijerinckia TaxID=2638183 RepID=UPI000897B5A4|nr:MULTISPECIES: hypothetical protein [unclassified Beijerinckia]MDH7799671.1 hypothetical protein [Beijerinckia sp. GAS462]SEB49100.1 hypothetical protein SAMN05443249_0163 [Beijerinckia sp. 28-YEA-48]
MITPFPPRSINLRKSLPVLLLSTVLLTGCNTTQPQVNAAATGPAETYSSVTPASFRMPEGSGCAGEVARWQAIQDNDRQTGNVNQSVYNQIKGDIDRASAACQAGRDGEARALVRASRARHGYPAS